MAVVLNGIVMYNVFILFGITTLLCSGNYGILENCLCELADEKIFEVFATPTRIYHGIDIIQGCAVYDAF